MHLHHSYAIHIDSIRSMAISPNGCLVAVGFDNGWIRLWELPSLRLVAERLTSRAEYRQVYGLAFTPDSTQLVSALTDGFQLLIWETTLTAPPSVFLTGPDDPDDAEGYASWDAFYPYTPRIDPSGTRLICGDESGRLGCWDLPTQALLWVQQAAHPSIILDIAIAPNGVELATAGYYGSIGRWNMVTGEGTSRPITDHGLYDCRGVAWSPDGTMLVSTGYAQDHRGAGPWQVLQRWDPATLTLTASYPCGSPWGDGVAFHPHQPILAMGTSHGEIMLWDTRTWQPIMTTTARANRLVALAWTADGQFLISAHAQHQSTISDQLCVWRLSDTVP